MAIGEAYAVIKAPMVPTKALGSIMSGCGTAPSTAILYGDPFAACTRSRSTTGSVFVRFLLIVSLACSRFINRT